MQISLRKEEPRPSAVTLDAFPHRAIGHRPAPHAELPHRVAEPDPALGLELVPLRRHRLVAEPVERHQRRLHIPFTEPEPCSQLHCFLVLSASPGDGSSTLVRQRCPRHCGRVYCHKINVTMHNRWTKVLLADNKIHANTRCLYEHMDQNRRVI
jgi:hypothetical protein